MAVTRIKNNQITDLTVNAAAKLQDFSITSGKIANNLTYGSDLTITGNLTVQGNVTAIDTTDLVVEDPLFLLAKDQTGSPTLDIGFIGKRGTEDNIAWIWDESADQFAAVFTDSEITNTTVNILSYASVKFLDLEAANLDITGNIEFSGNIVGNVVVTGNIDAGNFNAINAVTAVSGDFSGNIDGANINASTNVTAVTIAASGNLEGNNAVITNDVSTTTVSASGNIDGANVNATTNVTAATITASGNVDAGTAVNANLIAGTSVQIVSTGDLDLQPTGNISVSGKLIRDMADPELAQDAATKQYVDDAVSAGIHIHTPVDVETPTALPAATYNQGGNLATVTDTIAGNTVVFSAAISPQVNDQLWFANSFEGIVANIAYFVVSAPNTSAAVLTTQYNGTPVSNITSNTGLSESVRVNSGYGANLTANAAGALTVDGYSVSAGNRVLVYNQSNAVENGIYVVTDAGNGSASWVLTRSDDANSYIPDSPTGLDEGSYVYVKFGDTGAGESYVMTQPQGPFNIGQAAVTFTQFSASQVYSANTQAGLVLNGTVFSAKVDNETTAFDGGGNIIVKASANLTTPNIGAATGTSLSVSGNVTGDYFVGNIDGATGTFSGNVTADTFIGNIQGNIDAGGANTEIQFNDDDLLAGDANFTFDKSNGQVTISGSLVTDNVVINGDDITSLGSELTINDAGADINLRVEGDNDANLFIVDAGSDTVLIGTATPTTNAALKIGTTNSILVPVGNTVQRPGTPVTGMVRFNTSIDNLEFYDSDSWTPAGSQFTVVTADTFNGDGSTVQFTLTEDSTTAATIVAINGVVQQPTTAYSVSGNVLTFTEAPESTDVIDARILVTTTTVVSIQNTSGNAAVECLNTADTVQVTGNVIPLTSNTYNLGSSSLRWNELFLQGSTITLGNVVIKNTGGNTVGFFGPDGTTPGAIDTNNIDSAGISNGTSSLAVIASGGNIRANVAGNTVGLFSDAGLVVTGSIEATNGFIGLDASKISNGTSNVSVITSNGNVDVNVNGNPIVTFYSGGIDNRQSNGVGNIGTATSYFNTIFAQATSAQYADLAEMYEADAMYEPGTVLCFGGAKEVTLCGEPDSFRVAGVVSTNPSYLMNSGQTGDNVVAVALTGRVPCRVTGTICKGDLMVAAGDGRARANNKAAVGTVIGKALADFDGTDGMIEVVVGRV